MKVGIFDPYLNTLGGGEKYMLALAVCLSEKHDVYIFWDRAKEAEIKNGAMQRFGYNLDAIHVVDNIFSKDTPFIKKLWESQKYDRIIYLSDGSIPVSLKRNIIIHFQFPVEWVKKTLWTSLKLFHVKDIICNSGFTKLYIDKKFNVRSLVLYPPVEIGESISVKKENIILHVGRFGLSKEGVNFKKQDFMIEAFKKMTKDKITSGWRFVMVISVRKEDKEKMASLKSLIKGSPVEIIENPSNERLWEEYGRAKIYWHASGFGEDLKSHPERAEHFGIATAEAMGAGAVPVVINAGGQPEIVQDGNNGLLWNTEGELIKKTKQLITDSNFWKRLSDNGKESVIQFNKERFYNGIRKIIDL